jgi:hypothetical protein
MWVHEKRQSGQSYDKIKVNFAFRFNKAALTEANLYKLEGKVPKWFGVRCKTK